MSHSIPEQSLAVVKGRLALLRDYVAPRSEPVELRRFLILTSGRTGSELLVNRLNSHPHITCDSELLGQRRLSPERLLSGRALHASRQGKLAYGIKIKPKDIFEVQRLADPAGWLGDKHRQGWKVIHLSRLNRLHQAISAQRASSYQWHYSKREAKTFEPMAMNPFVIIGTMCSIAFYEDQISHLLEGIDHLHLTYETDLQQPVDQDATVTRICQLLGIELRPTETELERITPDKTRDMVTNYDEIAAEIRRNHFADFLPD